MTMRILVAEDDPVSARLISTILKKFGEVTVTNNGEEAFDAYCEASESGNPFAIAFLDIMMPMVDGQETLEAIREYESDKGMSSDDSVKVVMVTALTDGANVYQAHRNNCMDYISKPISKESIEKVMNRLVRSAEDF